jgi:hypothetical protein
MAINHEIAGPEAADVRSRAPTKRANERPIICLPASSK